MRLALVSNVTTSVLARLLEEAGCVVWQPSGFGAWRETALMPPSDLLAFDPDAVCLLIDRRFAPPESASASAVAEARAAFDKLFPETPVLVPDLATLAAEFGVAFYDERMWKLGKMPWSLMAQRALVRLLTPVKKVLALDLDGTLWEGIIAEDGAAGIRPKTAFLAELKALKARGVLLAALSKNDPDVADAGLAVCAQATDGALTRDDFVAVRADYGPKADTLADLAAQLNLSPDAFVFVDDNPAERAEMRARLPSVCVPAFPPQLDVLFPPRAVTDEDRARTAMYRAEQNRRAAASTQAYEGYLASLEIVTDIHPMRADEIARVAQLSQKTNQFNVCTNRYSEDDVRQFAADPNRLVLTLHARDRFGDLGLVAFVLAVQTGAEAAIADWVMSCRAMNRRLEYALEEALESALAARGVRRLTAEWRKTARNAPVADLFTQFGFSLLKGTQNCRCYGRTL